MDEISRLIEVPSTDPNDARRRRLLNILLAGVATIALIGLVTLLGMALLGRLDAVGSQALWAAAATLAGVAVLFLINRYGSGPFAAILFVAMLTVVFALSDAPEEVVDGRSVFLFTIPILMASVLVFPWAGFVEAGLCSLVISAIALTIPGYLPPLPTILGFFAFALVAWLSSRSLEIAVADLQTINRELDNRVELRTAELVQANQRLAEANERLKELDHLKSRFVSMVSHELRTPLSAIEGFAEILLADIYGVLNQRQRDAVIRVKNNSGRLIALLSDLLDQALIEAGQLSLHVAPLRPIDLMDDVAATMGVLAREKGLTLETHVLDDLPAGIMGDEDRLRQILINLVSNAIKFTEKGTVSVELAPFSDGIGDEPPRWYLRVTDTGPGIAPQDQAAIFDPFQRVDDSATRQHQGVGLGLAIVQELVSLMQGEINLDSVVGEGSTFTVILPLEEA